MYSGTDKYGGEVVGSDPSQSSGDNLDQIIESASAEETLVVNVPIDDEGNTTKVLLSSRLNPSGGGLMWVEEENPDQAYNTVVAMSQMTSMLRDLDRNRKYYHAIGKAIQEFEAEFQRKPVVLDIGSGTGLLSMMAAASGAARVYGCEMFPQLAEAAKVITKKNFEDGRITIIPKRSTQLIVGEGKDADIPAKVDLIVSEIFDTVLLGEGVLPTLRHAKQHLLSEEVQQRNFGIVPRFGKMYAQVIESEEIYRMHSFANTSVCPGLIMARSEAASHCSGGTVALPLHVDQLKNSITKLSEPFVAFEFDFNNAFPENGIRQSRQVIQSTRSGKAQAVLFWWVVDFNGMEYNTAPGVENWQDHWVQAVFPFGKEIEVDSGATLFEVTSYHSELNVWFDVSKSTAPAPVPVAVEDVADCAPEQCSCGLHMLCNAERISMLTNKNRNASYEAAITDALRMIQQKKDIKDTVCLDISDGSLCALIAATKGSTKVTSIESKKFSAFFSEQIVRGNGLEASIQVLECGCKGVEPQHLLGEAQVDLLMAEPFYFAMQNLPLWQALNFWYRRTALSSVLEPDAVILPHRAIVKMALVQFEHLYECFGEVNVVSGFDHSHLDEIQSSWHNQNFPYPLWMYPHTFLTDPQEFFVMEYKESVESIFESVQVPLIRDGVPHAVVVWIENQLDQAGNHVVSTGPSQKHCKQLVRFLPTSMREYYKSSDQKYLKAVVNFIADEGTIDLDFKLV